MGEPAPPPPPGSSPPKLTVDPKIEETLRGMCPHARTSWQHCPHCLGLNTLPPIVLPTSDVGELPPETRLFKDLASEGYRRWYRFGWSSPKILWLRTSNHVRGKWCEVKYAWQRAVRGYDDTDLWNVNFAIARLLVAACRSMREGGYSYPTHGVEDVDEWHGVLTVIETGMQDFIDCDGWFSTSDAEARFNDALANVARWFPDLWD